MISIMKWFYLLRMKVFYCFLKFSLYILFFHIYFSILQLRRFPKGNFFKNNFLLIQNSELTIQNSELIQNYF